MSNLKDKIMIVLFIVFLAVFSAGSFIYMNKDFSENENRYLQEFPGISVESVMDGTFEQDMEAYVSDRLTGRETLIGIKNTMLKELGITDAGGVYFCDDGYYIEKKTESDVDSELYKKNLKAIALFYGKMAENGIAKDKLAFMPVPTASTVLKDKLPANSSNFDEKKVLNEAKSLLGDYNVIDVTKSIMNVDYPYYKTDHHWTTDSAYVAYFDWCKLTGRTDEIHYFENQIVSVKDFRGTLYSKVLCLDAAYDEVKAYASQNDCDYTVTCDGNVKSLEYGFWDSSFEIKKDVYAGFYGGNYGVVHIAKSSGERTLSVAESKKLLLIKDSYANCFAPFLYEHFDEIYMVDLRYFNDNLVDFATENGITEVLSLFNISSFVDEKSIRKAGII